MNGLLIIDGEGVYSCFYILYDLYICCFLFVYLFESLLSLCVCI